METHNRDLNPFLADLLIHLVISHHGSGRPLVPPADDDTSALVAITIGGHVIAASANLAQIDWGQPSRFLRLHDELGPWGLALLEAIVRQSDHAVSAGAALAAAREDH